MIGRSHLKTVDVRGPIVDRHDSGGTIPSGARIEPASRSVRAARRTVSPRAQTALLPHAGFRARGRGPRAGDLFARMAQLRRVRGSGSFRAWLYRIATNACLNALASRKLARRVLPDQQAPPQRRLRCRRAPRRPMWPGSSPTRTRTWKGSPTKRPVRRRAIRRARPCNSPSSPPSRSCRRASAPRFCMCDVLGWAAAETATLLGGSTASINSALQRARETLAKRYPRRPAGGDAAARPRRSKNCSTAICTPGKGMISTASWRCSKKTRPSPCRRGGNGMRGARPSGPFFATGMEDLSAAFAWCRRPPTGSLLSPSMHAPPRTAVVRARDPGAGARG